MRRVSVLPYSADHVLILKRELKLMRAVVRAADRWADNTERRDNERFISDLLDAVDAFNKAARK